MGLFSRNNKQKKESNQQNWLKTFSSIRHITGLPAPENCIGEVQVNASNIVILCAGNKYHLQISKITNVDFQMDIDIQKYSKSSTLKGITGATMFGITGAIIGSAPKAKEKREVVGYIIISYIDESKEFKNIILKDDTPNTHCCAKLTDTLKPMIQNRINSINL